MAVRCQQALEGFSREVYEERIQPPGPAAAGDDRWTEDDGGERSFL
jgi:hypothetical protein